VNQDGHEELLHLEEDEVVAPFHQWELIVCEQELAGDFLVEKPQQPESSPDEDDEGVAAQKQREM
jgi:hypothetical protein